jgi:hypothetical protein
MMGAVGTGGPWNPRGLDRGSKMGLFGAGDQEAKQAKEDAKLRAAEAERLRKQQEAEAAEEAAFRATAQGQARTAHEIGQSYFQTCLSIATTKRSGLSMMMGHVQTKTAQIGGQGEVLAAIESEGWQLMHVGYVFQETGSVSRDKLLSSGQEALTSGQVIGIYLFSHHPENRIGSQAPATVSASA